MRRVTVRAAALRIGGIVYEGMNHSEALRSAEARRGRALMDAEIDEATQGFTLTDGSFVDRLGALRFLSAAEQKRRLAGSNPNGGCLRGTGLGGDVLWTMSEDFSEEGLGYEI